MNARIRFRMHRMGLAPRPAPAVPVKRGTPPADATRVYCDPDFAPPRWWQHRRYDKARHIAVSALLITGVLIALAFTR